jgi:hypothetical protein
MMSRALKLSWVQAALKVTVARHVRSTCRVLLLGSCSRALHWTALDCITLDFENDFPQHPTFPFCPHFFGIRVAEGGSRAFHSGGWAVSKIQLCLLG